MKRRKAIFNFQFSILHFFTDPQLLHPGPQGAPVKPEDLGRAVFTTHLPAGFLKDSDNIVPLHIAQGLEGFRRSCMVNPVELFRQPQFAIGRSDNRPFNNVLQFPDIAGPGIALQGFYDLCRYGINFFTQFPGKYR